MDINHIKDKIAKNEYFYSQHAEIERKADGLTFEQVEQAILSGIILEEYKDTGRGESCLILGFCSIPIHIVCGWRGNKIVIITTYIPKLPKFIDPWTRKEKE